VKKTLESGAVLELSICSFKEGTNLMKAVAKELKTTTIAFGVKDAKNFGDLFKNITDDSMNTLKNLVVGLLSSEEIEAALWPCMERGTYTFNNLTRKINSDLFEDEKVRADYLPILKEVLVFSLAPFFSSLKSLVWDSQVASTSTQ
jgi:hypothetical protein